MNELDERIVKEVMGYEVLKNGHVRIDAYTALFTPTTDANDADQVVDKMQEMGWEFRIEQHIGETRAFFDKMEDVDGGKTVFFEHEATDPDRLVAICKAALEAVKS